MNDWKMRGWEEQLKDEQEVIINEWKEGGKKKKERILFLFFPGSVPERERERSEPGKGTSYLSFWLSFSLTFEFFATDGWNCKMKTLFRREGGRK